MNENIQRLRELTPKLPTVVHDRIGNVVNYANAGEPGKIKGIGLFTEPNIAVQRCFMSAGSKIDDHNQEENEWLLVYNGKLRVKVEHVTYTLGVGEMLHIPPEFCHSAEAIEDTWVLGITIPASEGYP